MRIITGKYKGKFLKVPRLGSLRPTREMVRKAIFDVLGDFTNSKSVLDLFSGSGALGLESLSAGAKNVIFVEKNRISLKAVRDNINVLGVRDSCRVIPRDVFAGLAVLKKRKLKFQIVFADPPYEGNLAKKSLLEISNCDILLAPAIIVIEHYKKNELPETAGKLRCWQIKKYGDTFVSFYVPF